MDPDPGEVQAELRVGGDVAEITAQGDAEARADRMAVDRRQGGAGQVPDREEEAVERAHLVADPAPGPAGRRAAQVRLPLQHVQVAPGREGAPLARQDHCPDRRILGEGVDVLPERLAHGPRHRVQVVRIVQVEGDDVAFARHPHQRSGFVRHGAQHSRRSRAGPKKRAPPQRVRRGSGVEGAAPRGPAPRIGDLDRAQSDPPRRMKAGMSPSSSIEPPRLRRNAGVSYSSSKGDSNPMPVLASFSAPPAAACCSIAR